MTLEEYQSQAMTTCMKESENFSYMMLNLTGELGEFAGKVAKLIRKGEARIKDNHLTLKISVDEYHTLDQELRKEAGDILWQLSGLCNVMGWSLEDIALQNLTKLADRRERGVIDGSGDNR